MAGVAPPPEHRVRCLAPLTSSGGDEVLCFDLDGKECWIDLRIERLNQQLVAGLSDRALDLLEIAALVYAVDASVSRGGPTLQQMGQKWHRRFAVEMPVRECDFWQQVDVTQSLEELLMFLSGDRFTFEFTPYEHPDVERSRFFRFGEETAWTPDRVLMFSGGLDSFAGALAEIAEHGHRVALISHTSAPKMAPIARNLQKAMAAQFGVQTSRHFPVRMNLIGRKKAEGTHRSRSFLFAALGAVFASAFGQDRVSFHENGVVSLNLPPVKNVIGTRATRTTHPKSLVLMSRLLRKVFEGGMRVDNPFFWRTKTEVIQTISRLGMADQIRHTRSCADVHNQTRQHAHCGRCSQCIDRRFAVLAAVLANDDPAEAYKVSLMNGARTRVEDREIALSYVRNADLYEQVTPELIQQHFPDVLDAVGHLGESPPAALAMITDLLKRHGSSVAGVMRDAFATRSSESYPINSLPRMYGDEKRQQLLAAPTPVVELPADTDPASVTIVIDEGRQTAVINEVVHVTRNATFDLLSVLAKAHLKAAGEGRDLFEYPTIRANALAKTLGLESDVGVRQRVNRSRGVLKTRFASAGLDPEFAEAVIENVPGYGYRLAPDRVTVRNTGSTQ